MRCPWEPEHNQKTTSHQSIASAGLRGTYLGRQTLNTYYLYISSVTSSNLLQQTQSILAPYLRIKQLMCVSVLGNLVIVNEIQSINFLYYFYQTSCVLIDIGNTQVQGNIDIKFSTWPLSLSVYHIKVLPDLII